MRPAVRLTMRAVADQYIGIRRNQVQPATVAGETSVVGQLVDWWTPTRRSPKHLGPGDMEDYLYGPGGLRERVAATTFNKHAQSLAAFVRWAAGRGMMQHEVRDVIRRVAPGEQRQRIWLRTDQVRAMYDDIADPWERFAMALGVYTAGRDQELCTRRVGHVDLASSRIFWDVWKSKKQDRLPIVAPLDRELRRWLVAYQELAGPLDPDWYLIPQRQRVGREWVYHPTEQRYKLTDLTQRRLTQVLGLTEDQLEAGALRYEGTHALRRSAARNLFEELHAEGAGLDWHSAMEVVASWLHHSDVKQTAAYIGVEWFRTRRDRLLAGAEMFQPAQPEKIHKLEVVS